MKIGVNSSVTAQCRREVMVIDFDFRALDTSGYLMITEGQFSLFLIKTI